MRIAHFTDTQTLADAELQALREGGDPPERVWALWALALRHAPAPAGSDVAAEPSAGVRAHMAVILAGAGEVDLVAGLARLDPDATVRTAAMRVLVRFVVAGRAPWAPVADALVRDADEVREMILDELPPDVPADVHAAVRHALASASTEILLAALDATHRLGDDVSAIAPAVVRASPRVRARLVPRWLATAGPEAVARALADAPLEHRIELLGLLDRPTWEVVEPIYRADIADKVEALFEHRLSEVPPAVRIAWGATSDLWTGLAASIGDAIRTDGVSAFDPAQIAALRDRIDAILAEIDAMDIDPDEYEEWDVDVRVDKLRELRLLLG